MKKTTVLRIVGAVVLLIGISLIGRLDLQGPGVLAAVLGFAVGWEVLVVRLMGR